MCKTPKIKCLQENFEHDRSKNNKYIVLLHSFDQDSSLETHSSSCTNTSALSLFFDRFHNLDHLSTVVHRWFDFSWLVFAQDVDGIVKEIILNVGEQLLVGFWQEDEYEDNRRERCASKHPVDGVGPTQRLREERVHLVIGTLITHQSLALLLISHVYCMLEY